MKEGYLYTESGVSEKIEGELHDTVFQIYSRNAGTHTPFMT